MSIEINKLDPSPRLDGNIKRHSYERQEHRSTHTSSGGSSDAISTSKEVNLSPEAQVLNAGAKVPDTGVDPARVERIRAAIAEGHYHIDPVRLAENFMALEQQLV